MANTYEWHGSSISQEEWDQALELAERWKEVRTLDSYGFSGKNLGILARALLHLKVCYDENVKLNTIAPEETRVSNADWRAFAKLVIRGRQPEDYGKDQAALDRLGTIALDLLERSTPQKREDQ